jgi:hypothetical protein
VDTWFHSSREETDNNLLFTLRAWDIPHDFFFLFRENVMRSGVWHKILPVRGDSREVHPYVLPADLVYIDGDHSHEGCYRDIELYRLKARKIVCGDDYVARPGFGVIEAVTQWFPKHEHAGPFWWAML